MCYWRSHQQSNIQIQIVQIGNDGISAEMVEILQVIIYFVIITNYIFLSSSSEYNNNLAVLYIGSELALSEILAGISVISSNVLGSSQIFIRGWMQTGVQVISELLS